MLHNFRSVVVLVLSFLVLLASASPVKRQSSSCNPVRFNTVLPTFICAESTIDFAWEGGSGKYNIFRWDQDQVSGAIRGMRRASATNLLLMEQRIYYLENTGVQQIQFGWGEFDTYPAGISL